MRFIDMLSMSSSSLWKRKFRTILTILGVVIGVASIVVMISLGLGLSRSSMEMVSRFGGLTTISVREAGRYDSSVSEKDRQHLDDTVIETLLTNPHVLYAEPVIEINALAKSGAYENTLQIRGTTEAGLENQRLTLGDGHLPTDPAQLEFLYGNQVLAGFYNPKNRSGYWYDGTVPDIDLKEDPIFIIYDMDRYYSQSTSRRGSSDTGAGNSSTPVSTARPKKYLAQYSGLIAGGLEDNNNSSWYVYANIDALKALLKKEFRGRVIPGQPTKSNGKPYREIFYSSIEVEVDDMDNMAEIQSWITDLGYEARSNTEWIKSMQQQSGYIQGALGGIGAVSLVVAAIGIMNTMMMSIYERTREIGVMKVLGCDMRNIRGLFLMEAAYIGFFGGIIGILLSYIVSNIINRVTISLGIVEGGMGMSYIPPWLAASAMVFAVMVGVLSGFFPARRAMLLSPLAAIRNE